MEMRAVCEVSLPKQVVKLFRELYMLIGNSMLVSVPRQTSLALKMIQLSNPACHCQQNIIATQYVCRLLMAIYLPSLTSIAPNLLSRQHSKSLPGIQKEPY